MTPHSKLQTALERGHAVRVEFLDHVQSAGDNRALARCKVWGRVVSVAGDSVTIRAWETPDSPEPANQTDFTIALAVVKAVKFLR